ncbi:Protein-lysine N-methyltransferase efm4, partial [Coemansia sp. RSA 2320]
RGLFDLNTTLWSSWVVQGPLGHRFFFSGDTAYSSAYGNDETQAECPAFKQIGQIYGPMDLAAVAIGGYGPELFFCGLNSKPEHAVRIHEDIRSRKSVAIHWGTFMLTSEPVDEPPMSVQPLSDTASELSGEALRAELAKDKSHHLGGGRFHNPWPSFVQAPKLTLIKHVAFSRDHRAVNQSIAEGRAPEVVALDHESLSHPSDVQLTWLGHASVLAQIDGATILCDPVFSDRCSPVQWLGPKRYTKAPCQVSELPGAIDVLIISHNHYDHLDWNTLRQ